MDSPLFSRSAACSGLVLLVCSFTRLGLPTSLLDFAQFEFATLVRSLAQSDLLLPVLDMTHLDLILSPHSIA